MLALVPVIAMAQQSLYKEVIRQPTGNNGYEEYVQAADVALSSGLEALVNAVVAPNANGTRLSRWRAVASATAEIQKLVEQGNAKSVSNPHTFDFQTRLPELRTFRTIGSALTMAAQVDFADGRVNEGFATLLETLKFGQNVAFAGPYVFFLNGLAISDAVWRSLDENKALLSLPAANQMAEAVVRIQEKGNAWANAAKVEVGYLATVPDRFTKREDFESLSEIGVKVDEDVSQLSDKRISAIRSELRFAFSAHQARLSKIISLPEKDWITAAAAVNEETPPQDPIASQIFHALVPMTRKAVKFEIVRQTRLRHLRVLAAVTEYKWTNGYYPSTLSQLPDPSLANDPLTGAQFTYQRVPGSVEIYSEGTADTGRIGLYDVP